MANFICFWAIFKCCKCPNNKQIIQQSGHTGRRVGRNKCHVKAPNVVSPIDIASRSAQTTNTAILFHRERDGCVAAL